MFDPKKWIEKSWSDEDTKMIRIAGDDAKIRRLTGTQWEQYLRAINGKSDESSIAIVLQYGLVRSFGHYTYEEMVKLFDVRPMIAEKLASEILNLTLERMTAENQFLEDAEKNSEPTTTPSPSEDGAESMDKTPEPHE